MKVAFWDRDLRKRYCEFWSMFSVFISFVLIFLSVPDEWKIVCGGIFIVILAGSYIGMWLVANNATSAHIVINETNVNVIIGDIFEQDGLKVIGFNDFMDTIVDDKIVARGTLHGKFLKKYPEIVSELDLLLNENEMFNKNIEESNVKRDCEKNTCYKLGIVLRWNDYILTPFSKFNDDNEACLSAEQYIEFLMNFWKNIGKVYAGNTINIPLMGAGIVRFHDGKPSEQELLEIMIRTLKLSGFKCTYSGKSINFIIYSDDVKEIDFII